MLRISSMTTYHLTGSLRPRLFSLLLAGVLLMMQALVLQHQLDLHHHTDNEHCELCLHISPLDHAVTTHIQKFEAIPPIPVETTAVILSQPSRIHRPYQTRAPPSLS